MAAEKQNQLEVVQPKRVSLAETMAAQYSMEPEPFLDAIKRTVFPALDRKGQPPTNAHFLAFISACRELGLNPFLSQVWPFPMKDGGFKPVTSVDGFLAIMNQHPDFDGYEYREITGEKGELVAGEITIYRKSRQHPTVHREYLQEVRRDTEPWKMAHRMLCNRTTGQGVRRAFGLGLQDVEDAERAEEINVTAESVEMERTTATKQEALKEKIGKKREPKPLVEIPHEPLPPTAPAQPVDDLEPPPPVDEPEPLVTEAQRQEFLNAVAKRRPPVNGKLTDETRAAIVAKMREFGVGKLQELTVAQMGAMMTWTETL